MTEWNESLMGEWVTVTKRLERDKTYSGNGNYKVEWKSKDIPPKSGMITGRRWLKNGTLIPNRGSYDNYDPGYLIDTGIVPCVQVVFDSRHNPVYVPFEGFEERS